MGASLVGSQGGGGRGGREAAGVARGRGLIGEGWGNAEDGEGGGGGRGKAT